MKRQKWRLGIVATSALVSLVSISVFTQKLWPTGKPNQRPFVSTTLGSQGDFKCEKCKSLFAYRTVKYQELSSMSTNAASCVHAWEKIDPKQVYELSLKWNQIKWNKCGLWYRILTQDDSGIEEAKASGIKGADITFHPDFWIGTNGVPTTTSTIPVKTAPNESSIGP